jgi:hypothetical protein
LKGKEKECKKMKTKMMIMFAVFTAIAFSASGAFAADPTLTITDAEIAAGGTGTVTITVDDASLLAGASFTLRYTSPLSVTDVESTFFDTFVNQGFTEAHGLDAIGMVDGYSSPIAINDVTGTGTRLAAARKDGGSGTNAALFTLTVAVDTGATDGDTHDIEIIPTSLSNTNAGYASGGEEIALLVGYDKDAAEEYPKLLDKGATAETVFATGTITVGAGIPPELTDFFKMENLPQMSDVTDDHTPTADSDFDGDGYPDTTEWTRMQKEEKDSFGNTFNPMYINAPNDEGYVEATNEIKLGDLDGDGDVLPSDLSRAFEVFGGAKPTLRERLATDALQDGDISTDDLLILFNVFGGAENPYE